MSDAVPAHLRPLRPYLVRAIIDWVVDNSQTPHLVLDCAIDGVDAPRERAQEGKLVLNVSANATRNLAIGNDWLTVDCRFGGRPVHVRAPMGAVVGVYAKESGIGMAFEAESPTEPQQPPSEPKPAGPTLKLVK
jgi:stringent starvation protein B